MKFPVILSAGLMILAGCSNGSKVVTDANGIPVIDVNSAISSPSGIKASQLGSTITYVPLETNDSSLIGNTYSIYSLGDRLIVATDNRCLVFDMNTGKYLNSVSQLGQGPEDYINHIPVIDEQNGRLLFQQGKRNYISFSPDNKFLETIVSGVKHNKLSYAMPHDGNYIYHASGDLGSSDPHTLVVADAAGNVIDSLTTLTPPGESTLQPEKIESIVVYTKLIGDMGGSYALISDKDGGSVLNSGGMKTIWVAGDNVRFHENLTDTIYDYTPGKLSPAFIFNTGEHHYPIETGLKNPEKDQITVHSIYETDDYILSGVMYGSLPEYKKYDPQLYYVLYDKNDGSCSAQPIDPKGKDPLYSGENSGIVDDINQFVSIRPSTVTSSGAVLATVTLDALQAWMENNPDFRAEGSLSFINDLAPDANPVLIIIK